MQNKNMLIALIATVLILSVLPGILAVTTMSSPVTSGNYTTATNNISVIVTVDGNGDNNMSNVSCYYNLAGGAGSINSTYLLVAISNTTASQTLFTGSGTLATESAVYNITCLVLNGTTLNKSIQVTSVRADGTDPVVSLSRESSNVNMNGLQHLTWSAADTYLKSTTVTMTSPDSTLCPTQTWTDATSTNYIIPDQYLSCVGTYTVALNANDYSGRTASATSVTFTVDAPGAMGGSGVGVGGGGVPATTGVISGPGKTSTLNISVVLLIAAGIIVYFLIKKK